MRDFSVVDVKSDLPARTDIVSEHHVAFINMLTFSSFVTEYRLLGMLVQMLLNL